MNKLTTKEKAYQKFLRGMSKALNESAKEISDHGVDKEVTEVVSKIAATLLFRTKSFPYE